MGMVRHTCSQFLAGVAYSVPYKVMFGLRPSGQGMMKIIVVGVFEQARQHADLGHLFPSVN